MAVEVKCCIYNNDPRIIDKKPTLVKSIECRFTDPTDMTNPSIFVEYSKEIERCNYFVINFRKYFKVKMIKESNRSLRITLHEDVLSTWLPRVYVIGEINNASKIVSENMKQDYDLDVNRKISRIRISNAYEEITSNPITIVQSPLMVAVKE